MPTTLLIATHNAHKVEEIAAILAAAGFSGADGQPGLQLCSLRDYPAYQPPPEDGATFAENALLKAHAAARMSGLISLADDSGLCVDALGGAPGVHSARYAADLGGDHDSTANNRKLLAALADTPEAERGAFFIAAIAICAPDGREAVVLGQCPGRIARELSGAAGFGYDPLLYLPEYGKTIAELPEAEKNRISHRGRALTQALPLLREFFPQLP